MPTRYLDKLPEYKQDVEAIMKDPDLQNLTAVKKGYVYPIHEMSLMSYSTKTFFSYGAKMAKMALWA